MSGAQSLLPVVSLASLSPPKQWDLGVLEPRGRPDVLTFSLSQDSLAGLARPSMAKMETEGPQGFQERPADLACQALWGCQASVSLQPAWEPQRTPPHASLSLDPSRGREHQARTEPSRHPGGRTRSPLGGLAPHPSAQDISIPRTSVWDPGILRKRKF